MNPNPSYEETLRYSTARKRIWAGIVDSIVFWPLLLTITWDIGETAQRVMDWIYVLAPVIYSVWCHYKFGQTIGKWASGIKVMDVSETRTMTFRQAVLRDIPPVAVALISIIQLATGIRLIQNSFVGTILSLWFLAEVITMLTNDKRRALHDWLAKSVVVRT